MDFDSYYTKLKVFAGECYRVFKVTKKPTSFEFRTIVKVSALGMAIIGLVGFTLFMLKETLM
ncbi:protein translocase SEC61 complex subunit gamma [Candidatus Woesearchaeota archaeon]|nr:protein translocase SEC61 complex subunit gamma [Candidatus Woesearchaeota archaeon]